MKLLVVLGLLFLLSFTMVQFLMLTLLECVGLKGDIWGENIPQLYQQTEIKLVLNC